MRERQHCIARPEFPSSFSRAVLLCLRSSPPPRLPAAFGVAQCEGGCAGEWQRTNIWCWCWRPCAPSPPALRWKPHTRGVSGGQRRVGDVPARLSRLRTADFGSAAGWTLTATTLGIAKHRHTGTVQKEADTRGQVGEEHRRRRTAGTRARCRTSQLVRGRGSTRSGRFSRTSSARSGEIHRRMISTAPEMSKAQAEGATGGADEGERTVVAVVIRPPSRVLATFLQPL